MKTPIFPLALAALLLAGCSSQEKVVNNYYDDGLYHNEPSNQSGAPAPAEDGNFALNDLEEENQGNASQESLDYYDPQDARSNPRGNGGYSAGGDLTVNNFYGNGGGWNTGFYGGNWGWGFGMGFNTWNPYIYDPWFYNPWRGPGFYGGWGARRWGWGGRPWGWRSAGWYGAGWGWGGFNNYQLGYAHGFQNGLYAGGFYQGANDAWARNRVFVSTRTLSGRTGSYGARGTQTTRRYDRSGKRSTNTRMGGRNYNTGRSGRSTQNTRRETVPTSRLVAHTERNERSTSRTTAQLGRSAASGGSYSGRTYREAFNRTASRRESARPSASTDARPQADFRRSSRTYAPASDRQRSFQGRTRSLERSNRSNQAQPQRRPSRNGADRPTRSAPSRQYTPSRSASPNRNNTPSRNATPSRSNSRNRSYSPSRSSRPSRSTSPSRSSSPSRSYSPSRSSSPSRSASPSRSSSGRSSGGRSSSGRSSRSSRGR